MVVVVAGLVRAGAPLPTAAPAPSSFGGACNSVAAAVWVSFGVAPF